MGESKLVLCSWRTAIDEKRLRDVQAELKEEIAQAEIFCSIFDCSPSIASFEQNGKKYSAGLAIPVGKTMFPVFGFAEGMAVIYQVK